MHFADKVTKLPYVVPRAAVATATPIWRPGSPLPVHLGFLIAFHRISDHESCWEQNEALLSSRSKKKRIKNKNATTTAI